MAALPACALLFFAACGEGEAPSPRGEAEEAGAPAEERRSGEVQAVHERSLVFLSADPDSTAAIPWLFRTVQHENLDTRQRGVWLSRGEQWESLTSETDSTAQRHPPWNILPGRQMRLVLGPNGALETLLFRDPARPLEVRLGIPLAEWAGSGEESLRFHRATASLPSGEIDGYLLDLSVARQGPEGPPRDWMFLQGGEGFQAAFMERGSDVPSRTRSPHRAWTRWAVRENLWPEVIVEWAEVRPFERARRDVPMRWTLSSPGGDVSGSLEAVSQHLSIGEGDGPLLPVAGFFGVAGEIVIGGDRFDVNGIVRHEQR